MRLFCYSVSERGLFSMFKNNKKKIMLYLEGKNGNFLPFDELLEDYVSGRTKNVPRS